MPISLVCKHCELKLSVRDEWAGKKGVCPGCKNEIHIPLADQSSEKTRKPNAAPKDAPTSRATKPAAAKPTTSKPTGSVPLKEPKKEPAKQRSNQPATSNRVAESQAKTSTSQPAAASPSAPLDTLAKLSPAELASIRNQIVAAVKDKRIPPLVKAEEYRMGVLKLYAALFLVPTVLLGTAAIALVALIYLTGPFGLCCILPLTVFMLLIVLIGAIEPFMVARSSRGSQRRLTYAGEPFLHQFVHQLCLMLGAPSPVRIEVDCQVNASARNTKEGMVLAIGLPLVAGSNMNQLVGVLSHEIGHFTQTEAMASLSLLDKIQFWAAVVFGQDDGLGQQLSYSLTGGTPVVFVVAMFWWVTCLVLGLFFKILFIFVGGLLQRMEFDADRYEGLMVGSTVFKSTCYLLRHMGKAQEKSKEELINFLRQKKLIDNLPKLLVWNTVKLSPEARQEVEMELQSKLQAGLTDTHPPDLQRIQRVEEERQSGIFNVRAPSSALFNDFEQLCKNVTWDLFRASFGARFSLSDMHSLDELYERKQTVDTAAAKVDERFAGVFHTLRPVRNTNTFIDDDCDSEVRLHELKTARQSLQEIMPQYFAARKEFDVLDRRLIEAEQGAAGLSCSMYYPGHNPQQLDATRREAIRAKVQSQTRLSELDPIMLAAEQHQGHRIMAALDLMATGTAPLKNRAELEENCTDVLFALQAMAASLIPAMRLRVLLAGQQSALAHLREGDVPEPVTDMVFETNRQMHLTLEQMRESLDASKYPLGNETTRHDVTLGGFLGTHRFGNQHLSMLEDPFILADEVKEFFDEYYQLHRQLAGFLAETVENVEKSLGLPPLKQPKQ